MEKKYAPWTDKQVVALQVRQIRSDLHPYTCRYGCGEVLEVTKEGLKCPRCGRLQKWAYAEDLEGGI